MRPTIGIFDSSGHESGISRYVRALVRGIDGDEFDVRVISTAKTTVADAASPIRSAARLGWRALSPKPVNLLAGFGKGAWRLAGQFRESQFDLMHVQIVGADEAVLAARLAGVPRVIGTLHIDSSQSGASRWPVEAMTNHCLDRAIAVSEATAADWIRRTCFPSRRVTTIHNGVDIEHFNRRRTQTEARQLLAIEPEDFVIVAVGRLSEQKGFRFLLEAFAEIARQQQNAKLLIAGEGPCRAPLRTQARELQIADRVRLLGMLPDVRPLLEAADLFVLPSLWEAMPYALLEAMSMGVAPIATNVAGVPEVIEPNVNGVLVPPRDPSSLVSAIRNLHVRCDFREAIGKSARRRIVEHFDELQMIEQTVNVYRQVLHRRREGRLEFVR